MKKIKNLQLYLEHQQTLLKQAIPPKHQHRPEIYHAFLQREIKRTQAKIEELILRGIK